MVLNLKFFGMGIDEYIGLYLLVFEYVVCCDVDYIDGIGMFWLFI